MITDSNPAPRTPLNIEVNFRKSYARENTSGTLKNISLTGAFLSHTDTAIKIGEKIHLIFSVAGRERDVHAVIIWSSPNGSGVKFLPNSNRDVQIVDDFIYFVESKRHDTKDILGEIFKKVS